MITPCSRAFTCRIGPIVASSSAFMSTTSLPCSNAARTTCARVLDCASRLDDRRRLWALGRAAAGPSVIAVRPLRTTAVERLHGVDDHRLGARIADDVLGALEAAAGNRRQPHAGHAVDDLVGEAVGHEAGADDARPGSGVPAASSSRSAVSTRIIASGHRHPATSLGARSRRAAATPDPCRTSPRSAAATRCRVADRRYAARLRGRGRRTRPTR